MSIHVYILSPLIYSHNIFNQENSCLFWILSLVPCIKYTLHWLNASARQHQSFVNEAITELLTQNCIEEIERCPSIVNPLSVSIQSSGKKRLILDLRHVNKYVYKQKFKCEDIKSIIQLFDKGFYMFKFDLKSAFHHIEINEGHRKFLSFAWDFGRSGIRYFQFCVLPFGLSSAPFVFTKLLKPLTTVCRKQGIPIAVYLDDGLGAGRNLLSARSALRNILQINQEYMKVKDLASVVGQVISLEMAVGNVVNLMTRSVYSLINNCSSWHDKVQLDSATKLEFNFWLNNISKLNSKQLWPDNLIPSRIVYSDASAHACGAILNVDEKVFHSNWTEEERNGSSTWRELKTVVLAAQAFELYLKNRTIAWFTNNQNVVSVVSKGSRRSELQDLALQLFAICVRSHINLDIKWVPRGLNTQADSISQILDHDDYTINDNVFRKLDSLWGPHTVDRFACCYNAKLARFNSRFYQLGIEAVDAFTQNWSYNNIGFFLRQCL